MNTNESIHKGHRKRLFRNFLSGGKLTTVQTVEALLFYVFRQGDTNEIAHRLLERFGSFEELLCADEHKIASVEGMGEVSARKLRMILDSVLEFRRIINDRRHTHEWAYHSICAYLSERIHPRLMSRDVGCAAVILKEGMNAESYNLSSADTHLIRVINMRKREGELSLVCVQRPINGPSPINADEKHELSKLGVDAICEISACGEIKIDLI